MDGLSFNSGYNIPYQDIEKAAKYAAGSTLVMHKENPMDGMGALLGFASVIEGGKGAIWALGAMKDPVTNVNPLKTGDFKTAFANLKNGFTEQINIIRDNHTAKMKLLKGGEFKKLDTYKKLITAQNADEILGLMPKPQQMTQLAELAKESKRATLATKYFERAKEAAELAKKTPAEAAKFLKNADKYLAKGNAYAHGLTKATTVFGKIKQFVSKWTGLSKLSGVVKKFATKSPIAAKCLKFLKGNVLGVVIEGGGALIGQVIPTFAKLGIAKGLVQTGKSAIKVAASLGGWAIGAKMGALIGTGIGGPIGTVVGGLLGMGLGALCGWVTGKVAKAITGKDELEINKEQKAAKLAKEAAAKNTEAAQQILTGAAQRLEQEGIESEDAKAAIASINNLAKAFPSLNSASTSTTPATDTTTETTTTPAATQTPDMNAYMANLSNPFSEQDFMKKDIMAMSAGLA